MAIHKTHRVLNVFLASPGDVSEERDLTAEVVGRLNKLIGPKLGWHIELHKWEDAKPGYGRPQSKINPDVDSCDLFIGLLWERWGQPTGTHSSGFHEEFERATTRRESSGEPEIWLVFKKPRAEKLGDRGPELIRVIEFRETESSLRRDPTSASIPILELLLIRIRHGFSELIGVVLAGLGCPSMRWMQIARCMISVSTPQAFQHPAIMQAGT